MSKMKIRANSIIESAIEALKIEAQAILAMMDRLDERFEQAVDALYACKGRVIVTGIGKSGLIARKIASTFASTGTPSFFVHPSEGIHGDLGMIVKEDLVLALSNSGETEELASILPLIKRQGNLLIAMTGFVNSSLAKRSDLVLDVQVQQEACPLGLAPTASTTASAFAMASLLLRVVITANRSASCDVRAGSGSAAWMRPGFQPSAIRPPIRLPAMLPPPMTASV